jgi:hypothetical protein
MRVDAAGLQSSQHRGAGIQRNLAFGRFAAIQNRDAAEITRIADDPT